MWTTPPLHSATADRAAELGRHGNLGTEVADFGRAGGDDPRGGGGAEEMIRAAAEGRGDDPRGGGGAVEMISADRRRAWAGHAGARDSVAG
jgi:hypothetical protein